VERLHVRGRDRPRDGRRLLTGAVRVLRGDAAGVRLLRAAAATQVLFTISKLIFWEEVEATLFGVAALAMLALLRPRRRG
jgi:hypothetical protein